MQIDDRWFLSASSRPTRGLRPKWGKDFDNEDDARHFALMAYEDWGYSSGLLLINTVGMMDGDVA